ncbi:hypothetical protein PG994_011951 [Apiospora phragmitis]|uniref:BZIP domain-containing protein n=1 Tax=Apiospora phragmitis TaxID=2905665 RepID=A0ABR1TUA9_9PEZI
MEFCPQPSDHHLAYELPQSPMGTSCDPFLDPCITAAYQNDPQHFFDLPPDNQDSMIKLEDIGRTQPWESFSSNSESGVSEVLEPMASTTSRRESTTSTRSVKKPRRDRTRSGSSGGSTDLSREKNRIAASKCRRKKKDEERVLEDRQRMLQVQNAILVDSATSLRAEVLQLKHEILRHGTCDFQPINSYIATAAARVG